MDLINKFRDKYIELENLIKKTEKNKETICLEEYPIITNIQEKKFIKTCREMRNILSHTKCEYNGKSYDYFVPTEEVIEKLEKIVKRIKNPKTVMKICIPLKKIYYKKMEDLIFPTMKDMTKFKYTHIPILDENKNVIGVFSENTIFSYLLEEEIVEVNNGMRFEDLDKTISLKKHSSEIFKFVKKTTTLREAKNIFKEELEENERIGMVFVTENGKKEEKILGIFTSWDLAGVHDE